MVFSYFLFHLFFSSILINPVKLKPGINRKISRIMPQNWPFFTRDFNEAELLLYKKNNHQKYQIVNLNYNHYSNSFGLKKKSKKIIQELTFLKRELHDSLFISTEGNHRIGLLGAIPDKIINIKNHMLAPILCGEYVLFLEEPIPWAWIESKNILKMPSKAIRLNIQCP
ncbi:SdpA family antimicrobial peptide system protein [Polaribacter sp.]|uniref:SdpA family antimicrobial peptide system protein n=1 Tax=Polaribacter sp. TaxID=1920175 RepID=UPI003EFADD68